MYFSFSYLTTYRIYTRESQHTSTKSFSELSEKIENLGAELQTKIVALQANIEVSAENAVSYRCQDLSKDMTDFEA